MIQDCFEIEKLVNHLIVNNRALNQCRQDEQRYYSANDNLAIMQANTRKVELNANLKQILDRLDTYLINIIPYGDLLVKLSYYAGTLDARNQSSLLNLIQSLREEYKLGLQLMQLDRRPTNTNVNRLKDYEYT